MASPVEVDLTRGGIYILSQGFMIDMSGYICDSSWLYSMRDDLMHDIPSISHKPSIIAYPLNVQTLPVF